MEHVLGMGQAVDKASCPDGERNDRDLPLSRYGHEEVCDGLVLCHLLGKIWARGKAYTRVMGMRYLQEVHAARRACNVMAIQGRASVDSC